MPSQNRPAEYFTGAPTVQVAKFYLMMLALLAFACAVLIAYPVAAGALFVLDTLAGEGLFLYQVVYEQRKLFDTYVADYLSALPAVFLVALLLLALAWSTLRLRSARFAALITISGGTTAGYVAAVIATGTWLDATHLALALAGTSCALLIAFAAQRLFGTRATERPL